MFCKFSGLIDSLFGMVPHVLFRCSFSIITDAERRKRVLNLLLVSAKDARGRRVRDNKNIVQNLGKAPECHQMFLPLDVGVLESCFIVRPPPHHKP